MLLNLLGLATTTLLLLSSSNIHAELSGQNSITPHYYVKDREALANNPIWCERPITEYDISRITAVMDITDKADCGSCLRIVTDAENCGAIPNVPFNDEDGTINTEEYESIKANYQTNQVKAIAEGKSETAGMGTEQEGCQGGKGSKRWVYVMAADQGGSGLDVSGNSFAALFQQPNNPTAATWETVDAEFCEGIDLGEGHTEFKFTPVSGIKVFTGDDPSSHTPGSD